MNLQLTDFQEALGTSLMAPCSTSDSDHVLSRRQHVGFSCANEKRSAFLPAKGLVAVALLFCSSTAGAALIELKETAAISTAVVRLGQVSVIHDADEKLVERLAGVTLFPAPSVGKSKAVDFETIRERLTSQGFNVSELEFSGSSTVTVSGVRSDDDSATGGNQTLADIAQKRAEELVTGAVRQYLREKAASLGNVQIEMKLTPRQVSALTAALSARVDITGGVEPWSGEQAFRAGFYDKQGKRTEFQVVCRVRPLPQVLVPTATLPKGHVVRPDDVSWKQQPATATLANYVDRAELVVGQETRRTLRAGEPIATVDVRGIPLVRRGDIVTVVARSRGIVIRTDAKAMADGSLGQPIKLMSLDGRRELVARVSGYHEATVGGLSGDEALVQGTGTGVRLLTAESQNQPAGRQGDVRPVSGIQRQRPTSINPGER
jgi:flagella basal body P-ring formation protein FlgA